MNARRVAEGHAPPTPHGRGAAAAPRKWKSYSEKYGGPARHISAVDLVHGLANLAGLDIVEGPRRDRFGRHKLRRAKSPPRSIAN